MYCAFQSFWRIGLKKSLFQKCDQALTVTLTDKTYELESVLEEGL
jgi:hypothetical protein